MDEGELDWRRVGFDWNRARAFLVTADLGSFSAAARALGTAQPTIGRQVAALEDELEVALFERSGGGLRLTPTGLELVEHVRTMAQAATQVSRVAAGQSVSLSGSVCISSSQIHASHVLPAIVAGIRQRFPEIEIEIVASLRPSDLSRREADIAIRNFRPTQGDLVAKKTADAEAHLYATPGYLASLGHPTTPGELAQGDFIGFDHGPALRDGLQAIGLPVTPKSFPWITEDQHVQWALVTQGSGIGVMLTQIGDADPRVVRALPDLPGFPVPLYVTTHREVRTSRRVRVVFDLLVDALRKDRGWPLGPPARGVPLSHGAENAGGPLPCPDGPD